MRAKKRALTVFLAAVVLLAGSYYAYHSGFVPGMGQGKHVASSLKHEIEVLKGNNIEDALIEALEGSAGFSAKKLEAVKKELGEDSDITFSYSSIKHTQLDGFGAVVVNNAHLTFSERSSPKAYEIIVPKLTVARSITDKGHLVFITEGEMEIYASLRPDYNRQKLFSIGAEHNQMEFKSQGGMVTYTRGMGKNYVLKDAKGGTDLLKIAMVDTESVQSATDKGVKISGKAVYSGIEPGDIFKLIMGITSPVDVNIKYSYEGGDFYKHLSGIEEKAVEGNLKLEDFSVKIAQTGVFSAADLKFGKGGYERPSGYVRVVVPKYKQMAGLLGGYLPAFARTGIYEQMLTEMNAVQGADAVFKITFDSAEPKVNGLPLAQFTAIREKYFPKDEEDN